MLKYFPKVYLIYSLPIYNNAKVIGFYNFVAVIDYNKMKKFLKIISYIIPYKFYVLLNVGFNILTVIFSLFSFTMAIPFLGILFNNQTIVNEPVPLKFSFESVEHNFNYYLSQIIVIYGEKKALLFICILVIVMVLFKTSFMYLASYFMAPLRNGVIKDIRNRIYNKIIQLPLSYFSEERKGDIISRMSSDVQEIEVSIIRSLTTLFKEPITIVVYFSSLVFMSPQLTLFVVILLPISGYIIGVIGKNLRKTSLRGQRKLGTLLSIIEETLTGLRIIKAFNAENKVKRRFNSINSFYTRLMIKMWRRRDLAVPVSELFGTIVIICVMWYGGMLVLGNETTLSSQVLMGYLIIFSQIINPAKSFSSAYYNIQKGMASAERVDEVLNADISIKEKPDAKQISEFNSDIEYRNVSFKYNTDYVLNDINLKIEKGKTIAIVGQSGSGKSTLVDLLPRFYDTTQGDVLIDGIFIKDYKISDLRNLMGNVNQEPILFNDSFFNNIAFGADNITEKEVIDAAKVANAHDFIMEYKNDYYTNIGDRGGKLSGGQRQRISIARAVLKNPPILILDEATSSLDTESERLVQDALTKLMKNRTSIVIAHRLSTVMYADEICVLHQGKIVERGTHNELIKKNGFYKKLHDLQMFL